MNVSCEMTCENCNSCKREQVFIDFRDKNKRISEFFYDSKIHSKPTSILLSVTNRCNLNCTYCFVKQNAQNMSLDTAIKGVEFAIKNGKEKNIKPYISFFGGEPLLMFNEIIVPIVEKYKNEVDFGITTNGILLDEDKVDFFYKNNIQPLLSFDGTAEVQNSQRPKGKENSFELVLKNIPYLLLRFPNTVMRSTVTKNSIPYLQETVNMASELGFQKITFCPNAYENWDKETEKQLKEQFFNIGLDIYEKLFFERIDFPIEVNPIVKRFQNIEAAANGKLKFNNEILRCGLGTTTCAIAPNGDLIPCQEKTSNPTYIIGHVESGIDCDKHQEFLNWYFNSINNIKCDKGCSERERLICLSDICPSRLEDMDFNFSSSACAFIRASTKVAARLHFLCSNSSSPKVREYFKE